uniref:Uncharacterized protein n=1 Tax=Rhizophora mucronata TaxID=61149 RepID=A0A2P2KA78_RHIMU
MLQILWGSMGEGGAHSSLHQTKKGVK